MLIVCETASKIIMYMYLFNLSFSAVNTQRWHNKEKLDCALDRNKDLGLITLTNHHTTIDDPFMWGKYILSI